MSLLREISRASVNCQPSTNKHWFIQMEENRCVWTKDTLFCTLPFMCTQWHWKYFLEVCICCCSFIIILSRNFSKTFLFLCSPSLSLLLSHPFLLPLFCFCCLSISSTNIVTSHLPFSTYGHPSFLILLPSLVFFLFFSMLPVSHPSSFVVFSIPTNVFCHSIPLLLC